MHFNIISLQRLRAANLVYIFNEIPRKAVIKNARGGMVALMTESENGRLTLDCKILSTATPLASNRRVEVSSNPIGPSEDGVLRRLLRGDVATGIGQATPPPLAHPYASESRVSESPPADGAPPRNEVP